MNRFVRTPANTWRGAAAALAAAATGSIPVAAAHVWATAQRGVICGVEPGHCWACYAAPLFALGALALWRVAQRAPAGAGTSIPG